MKFTLSWLKDHLETSATLDEILVALTSLGLEVEGVSDPAARLAGFKVARVLTAERHPQADKLQVLSVDIGDGTPLQVVCGAPNARACLVGVLGLPGATVPANGMALRISAIRGVESNGMMCSTRELELGDDHDGIIELPADSPVGADYAAWAGLDDPVIEVAITPNRQDCMGVHGIARDLAAAGIGSLKAGTVELIEGGFPSLTDIKIEDLEGCPAFYGRTVRGVANRASPAWLQQRLRAIGLRPISALVDITNYVSFDRGRPLHVYDTAKLSGDLVVRRAVAGETLLALNGKTYTLDPSMTVIADGAELQNIGGIMGGETSAVSETTTDVLIECAYFSPERIGATGRKLGINSDARARLERGVDPAFLEGGVALATKMVLDLCGGEPSEVLRAGTPPVETKTVAYRPGRTESLAGVAVEEAKQADILSRLGFKVVEGSPWQIGVPTWRRDVDGEADIVEEVVRLVGFDAIPSTALPRAEGVARPTATPAQTVERRVRRAIAARGLDEAVTWSFIAPEQAAPFGGGAWTLENAISADLAVMRPSLLPGLLSAAKRNADRGAGAVRLFELGRRYLADAERSSVGIVLTGDRTPRDWRGGKPSPVDAFDAKAEAIAALAAAGAPVANLQTLPGASPWYHPGRSGRLCLGPKTVLAEFGELHPSVARTFDLRGAVAVAELFLDALPNRATKRARSAFAPPALQAVGRDFAFVVDASASADALLRAVKGADKAAITDVQLFDRFELPDGRVSLAVSATLQPTDRSFTDEEIEAVSAKIVAAAEKAVGAVLRG